MAQIIAQCPYCKQQFNALTEWIGRQTNCPACGMVFTIQVNSNSAENLNVSSQTAAPYSGQKRINKKLLWIIGGAISAGICLSAILFLYFFFSSSSASDSASDSDSAASSDSSSSSVVDDYIPLPPKFDETWAFSWKDASIDKIRKWNKKIISEKESDIDGELFLFINAVGMDGVTRSFQFNSSKQLIRIMCNMDVASSADIMVKLNKRYNTDKKPVLSDNGKHTTITWMDKDSNTEIKIITLTRNSNTFLTLSYRDPAETPSAADPPSAAAEPPSDTNNIPLIPPRLYSDAKFPFSWKNASVDKIREWNKEIVSDKISDDFRYIQAVGKDGVTRMFQFDSSNRLVGISYIIDNGTDSGVIVGSLDVKYNTEAKPVTTSDGYQITTWEDKDSKTLIKIIRNTRERKFRKILFLQPEQ